MLGARGSLPVRPSPRLCLWAGRLGGSSFDQTVQTRGGGSREATCLEGPFFTTGILEGRAGPICLSPDPWRPSLGQVYGVGPGGRLLSPRGLWPVCGRGEGVSVDGHRGAHEHHSIAAGGTVSEELPGRGATVSCAVTQGPSILGSATPRASLLPMEGRGSVGSPWKCTPAAERQGMKQDMRP